MHDTPTTPSALPPLWPPLAALTILYIFTSNTQLLGGAISSWVPTIHSALHCGVTFWLVHLSTPWRRSLEDRRRAQLLKALGDAYRAFAVLQCARMAISPDMELQGFGALASLLEHGWLVGTAVVASTRDPKQPLNLPLTAGVVAGALISLLPWWYRLLSPEGAILEGLDPWSSQSSLGWSLMAWSWWAALRRAAWSSSPPPPPRDALARGLSRLGLLAAIWVGTLGALGLIELLMSETSTQLMWDLGGEALRWGLLGTLAAITLWRLATSGLQGARPHAWIAWAAISGAICVRVYVACVLGDYVLGSADSSMLTDDLPDVAALQLVGSILPVLGGFAVCQAYKELHPHLSGELTRAQGWLLAYTGLVVGVLIALSATGADPISASVLLWTGPLFDIAEYLLPLTVIILSVEVAHHLSAPQGDLAHAAR